MARIPYDRREVDEADVIPSAWPGFPDTKKFKTPVPARENYKLLYGKKELPHWIPISGDQGMFAPRIDADNIARAMVIETNRLTPEEMVGGKDKHGIEWEYVPVAGGSMVKPGNPTLLDANDWEKVVPFPDVASWDWEGTVANNLDTINNTNQSLMAWVQTGFFERLISLMDFDKAALAMIDEDQKDAVKALFNRLADMYIEMVNGYVKYFNVSLFCLHDDWGSQRAPFFSLDTVMEMVVPYLSRVIDAVHKNGIYFDMHSCGKNELLVPAYIAAGADSWSGQPMNDKDMIYDKYGDKIILGMELGAPLTMESTDADYVAAAKAFIAKYGPNYDKKPVLCSAFVFNPIFTETLYEESRKMFG